MGDGDVKRYDLGWIGEGREMVADADGDYMLHADHAARVADLVALTRRAIAALDALCGDLTGDGPVSQEAEEFVRSVHLELRASLGEDYARAAVELAREGERD